MYYGYQRMKVERQVKAERRLNIMLIIFAVVFFVAGCSCVCYVIVMFGLLSLVGLGAS